jgi:LPXTG-motif cell wall-anchored protein
MNKKIRKSAFTKVFACIASLFVLMSCFMLGASAAGKITADTTTFTAKEGDVISIVVNATDVANTECGDLRFTYDAEALEYVEDSVGEKNTYDADMCVGGEAQPGLVTCSFVFTNAFEEDDMKVCTLKFKVLKTGTSELKTEVGSWEGCEAPVVEISNITVNAEVETTEKKPDETTTEKTPDETTTEKTPDETTTEKVPEKEEVSEDESDVAFVPDDLPQTGDSTKAVMIAGAVMGLAAIAFVSVYYTKIKKD